MRSRPRRLSQTPNPRLREPPSYLPSSKQRPPGNIREKSGNGLLDLTNLTCGPDTYCSCLASSVATSERKASLPPERPHNYSAFPKRYLVPAREHSHGAPIQIARTCVEYMKSFAPGHSYRGAQEGDTVRLDCLFESRPGSVYLGCLQAKRVPD